MSKAAATSIKRRRRWRRILVLIVAAPLVLIATFWAAVFLWPYPQSLAISPSPARWLTDRHRVMLAALAAPDGQWRMALGEDQISPHLLRAIVAIEDHRFYDHGGIDWRSGAGAAWEDLSALRIRRGGSTITMQLQRLRLSVFQPQRRSFTAKIAQALRATQIERAQTKQQILVEYLNRAPFGGNIIGAGAASWHYFERPCRVLTLGQAALLAG